MYKKTISIILTIAVMFTMLFGTGIANANEADTEPATTPVGTAISTAQQLLWLNGKSGNYYLENDIDLKDYPNRSIGHFSGVLDGNGYTIYNYTVDDNIKADDKTLSTGLFMHLDGAGIKNLNLSDVNINLTLNEKLRYCSIDVLCDSSSDTSFENINVSGNINVVSTGQLRDIFVEGLGSVDFFTELSNCESNVNICIDIERGSVNDLIVSGIGGLDCDSDAEISNCKSTGNIIINVSKEAAVKKRIFCEGLFFFRHGGGKLISCGNTGDFSVTNLGQKCTLYLSGLCNAPLGLSKCYNKGHLTAEGRFTNINVNGLTVGSPDYIKQCYNKGPLSVNLTSKSDEYGVRVAGLADWACKNVSNSYNAGKINCTGKWNGGNIGGLLIGCDSDCKIANCYSSGKITLPSDVKCGAIMAYKRGTVKNNYFRYGSCFANDSAKSSQAKKVKAINKTNCPELSSDYWTYSKSKKRLILKKNKEQ